MPEIKGVAHFSIPVSDVDRSTKFYTEIVGCKFLSQRPDKGITFLDAGGVCVLLIKRSAPIIKGALDMSDGVHHAFMVGAEEYQAAVDGLRAKDVDVFSRKTAAAARSTGRERTFAIPTARPWRSSIARHTSFKSKPAHIALTWTRPLYATACGVPFVGEGRSTKPHAKASAAESPRAKARIFRSAMRSARRYKPAAATQSSFRRIPLIHTAFFRLRSDTSGDKCGFGFAV